MPTLKPPTTTRQAPTPTDETLAIRALRDVRKLDAAIAKLERDAADKKAERAELLGALPDEANRILLVLQGK